MSIKLADHPYFTRSKGPADSFPGSNAITDMGDNNEQISLTDVVVAKPTVAEQNELIAQLMQQIADMRVEMQRRRDLLHTSPRPTRILLSTVHRHPCITPLE